MKYNLTIVASLTAVLAACGEPEPSTNLGEYTRDSRPKIQAKQIPFHLPAGDHSIYKERDDFYEPIEPKAYVHPDKWVVYMASPGWTYGGTKIETRLSSDAASVDTVSQFVSDNNLQGKVKVAWLQYDRNPHANFLESLETVPSNFIPFFLKPHGPNVDYFIHSPASRYEDSATSLRYDKWLKPYLAFTKKEGSDYVTDRQMDLVNGFSDFRSPYWDNWSRHWFIVNPEGVVVDAYFSYIGNVHLYNSSVPISSLIYHLELDPDDLVTVRPTAYRFPSLYTAPYWEGVHDSINELLEDAR